MTQASNSVLRPDHKVFVAGHRGMVGSAIVRGLIARGHRNIVTRTRGELDLTDQAAVHEFFRDNRFDHVVLAAARVGGIRANDTYPAYFIYENLAIQNHVIHAAHEVGVKRLLFLGSSCIYPKMAPQPMSETSLLTGYLEPTNEPYAVAKIAGIKMCESYSRQFGTYYRSVMPTNLYGEGDNFNLETSHAIPAIMRRAHEAKLAGERSINIWGTGNVLREFMHVRDMADACIHVMAVSDADYAAHTEMMCSHINVGTGQEVSIRELAETIRDVVGFEGELEFDPNVPEGPPRKRLDVSRLTALGWSPQVTLRDGLAETYAWFMANHEQVRK